MISNGFITALRRGKGAEGGGRAVICGVKLPREVLEPTLSRPRTWLKSSSAEGLAVLERGRSSFASSVARAMNVERGSVTPRVV